MEPLKRRSMARAPLLAAVAFAMASLAGTSALAQSQVPEGSPSASHHGGRIVVAQSSDPDSLNPSRYGSAPSLIFINALYDSLVRYDLDDYSLQPGAVESWTQSDDGTAWTLKLREGITFHDGRPATAEDLVYSIEEHKKPEAILTSALLAGIESAEAVDDLTVQLTLSAPDVQLLDALAGVYLIPADPSIDFQANPIGSGPFRFVSWTPSQQIELERNPDYWRVEDGQRLPYLDAVTVKVVPDASVRALQVQNGEADIAPIDFPQVETAKQAGVAIPSLPEGMTGGYYDIRINTRQGPLADPLVREALSNAIDREAIATALFGLMPVTWTPVPLNGEYFNPDAIQYQPRNLDLAKEQLAQAGYPDGVHIGEMLTHPELSLAYQVIPQLVQQQAAEAGITFDIKPLEIGALVEQVYTNVDFDLFQSGNVPQPNIYDRIAHNYAKGNGEVMGWQEQNPEFYELLDRARTMVDPAEFRQAIFDLQAMAMEGQPNITIGGLVSPLAVAPGVQDFVPHVRDIIVLDQVWLDR